MDFAEAFRGLRDKGTALVSTLRQGLVTLARVLWSAGFSFATEEALIRASSLAFTTLLSLVPLLTLLLRLLQFYQVSDDIRALLEQTLAQYFLPRHSRDIVAVIFETADAVTRNIGLVGLLSFVGSLVLLVRELEGHILKICNQTTTWTTSLLHYGAFLLLAPALLVGPLLLVKPFLPWFHRLPRAWSYLDFPFLFSAVVLVALLRALSGYALGWRASAAGAASAALAAWGAWQGCLVYFDHSAALTAYGTLACFPAFLLWVFVAWCCVLFGVQVAAKTQAQLAQP